MATSSVTLYSASSTSEWELIPSRLLKVDSIADYLALKTKTTINNFQYIKPELETAITVDLSQTYASPLMPSYKYVAIHNSDDTTGKTYYYFIKNAVWRSKSTVRFELVMDVLNTFTEGSDFTFKDSTKITREHKDRFYLSENKSLIHCDLDNMNEGDPLTEGDYITIYTYPDEEYLGYAQIISINYSTEKMYIRVITDSGISEVTTPLNIKVMHEIEGQSPEFGFIATITKIRFREDLYRKIDYVPEGINPVLQYGKNDSHVIEDEKELLRQNWYLLYRNKENPMDTSEIVNPVDCYLIPENTTPTDSGVIAGGRLIPSWLEEGKVYIFNINLNPAKSFTLSNGYTFTSNSDSRYYLIVQKSGTKMSVTFLDTFTPTKVKCIYSNIEYITFSPLPVSYAKEDDLTDELLEDIPYLSFSHGFNNTQEYTDVDPITLLDRTDVKNIKLIKLPYCPYDFTISGGNLAIDGSTDWEMVSLVQAGGGVINVLHLIDLNTKLTNTFVKDSDDASPYHIFDYGENEASITDLKIGKATESKLFHSEFYRPTYVYDSFSFVMQLEKLDNEYYYDLSNRKLSVKFTMTSTINSKFMFTFTNYEMKMREESYYNIMTIARNNEEVLYNIPYINYIRTGFNYDKKQKALQNTSNFIGIGASALTIGASLMFAPAPLKIAGVIGGIVSFAMSTKNAVVSAIKSEDDLKQKLLQKKQESASVDGSDDVDLMSEYAGNRMKYIEYTPTEVMSNLIYNLFFYAGYSSGRMGLPNHNTRVNFDYLECDAIIQKVANIPDEILSEIVNCYKNGVTYLHKTSRAGLDAWDFEQKYENWESALFN